MSFKEWLGFALNDDLRDEFIAGVLNKAPKGTRANTLQALAEVFFWQEVEAYADKKLKEAWVAAEPICGSDETMRAIGEGEHVCATAPPFCVSAKISKPRETVDRDVLIANIARKFKIEAPRLLREVERAKVEGKPSLTKRVLEFG